MTTATPTSAVNPSAEGLDALAAAPDDDAIAMLNVLRYAGDAGLERYRRYAEVATGTITARGGTLLFLGTVIDPESTWDSVAIVRYPCRSAFLDMQDDPAYRAAIPDRSAGLDARMLYPFHLPADSDGFAKTQDAGVVAVELRRDGGDAPVGGRVMARLGGDGPGLVTDEAWDELLLVGYDSLDSWCGRVRTSECWSIPTEPAGQMP